MRLVEPMPGLGMTKYLYIENNLQRAGQFESEELSTFTERHRFQVPTMPISVLNVKAVGLNSSYAGIILQLSSGLPGRADLRWAERALRNRLDVFFYWPAEEAAERIDRERLSSYWRHWTAYQLGKRLLPLRRRMSRQRIIRSGALVAAQIPEELRAGLEFAAADYESTKAHILGGVAELRAITGAVGEIDGHLQTAVKRGQEDAPGALLELQRTSDQLREVAMRMTALQKFMDDGQIALNRVGVLVQNLCGTGDAQNILGSVPVAQDTAADVEDYRRRLDAFAAELGQVPLTKFDTAPSGEISVRGMGVYLRTDYWAELISGGSYGHTCYVAKELAKASQDFVCLMGSNYQLLDDLGLRQELIRPPLRTASEIDWMKADAHYYELLRARLMELKPAYIYERLCLGNFAAARLSRELRIPYILEYNGSEISMRRSFGSGAFAHEDLLLRAERLAFEQATIISVVSDHVRSDVLGRGLDPGKVITNPNGVDCEEYAPPSAHERHEIRASLGISDDATVVGFVGTFGGWHGIDVLAKALPDICAADPRVQFLLIGDGQFKPLVLDSVRKNALESRVVDVGRTKQRMGARLLKAADICVSPHSSHMKDSRFFGSPTKLFEYMALGSGIVASDLEQIGEVMSPALRPADFAQGAPRVRDERGVLCRPGNVAEFVAGVLALVREPEVAKSLGRNARSAALSHYSWARHVSRTLRHAAEHSAVAGGLQSLD